MNRSVNAGPAEWPYPVTYGNETEISGDVLVIGSGMSGCFAAVSVGK